MGSMGGIRTLISTYEMAIQHYEFGGTGVAYMKGKLRKPDGKIEKGGVVMGYIIHKGDLGIEKLL